MHVVRTPVDRAAAAIEAAPGTVEHAARGPGVLEQRLLLTGRFFRGVQGPSRPRKNLPEARRARMSTCEARSGTAARVDLTAPVKIYIIIIVQMHRNEHEFYCVKSLCRAGAVVSMRLHQLFIQFSPVLDSVPIWALHARCAGCLRGTENS